MGTRVEFSSGIFELRAGDRILVLPEAAMPLQVPDAATAKDVTRAFEQLLRTHGIFGTFAGRTDSTVLVRNDHGYVSEHPIECVFAVRREKPAA